MGVSIYIFWNLIVLPKYLIIYLRGTKIYFFLYLNRVKFRYSTQCCSLKILRAYKEQHLKYMYLSFVYLNNNVEKNELSKVYMSISKEINNLFLFWPKYSA